MDGNKIVLKASEKIKFRVQQKNNGDIVIEAIMDKSVEVSKYSDNYRNPVIPNGFEYVKGEWNTGLIIKNKNDEGEFIWVPVGCLEADGTLDGINFIEKFGRRKFNNEYFSEDGYYENVKNDLFESIKKYGGFYISACLASLEPGGKVSVKKGNSPRIDVNRREAEGCAYFYVKGTGKQNVCYSCLPNGAVYDTIFKWIMQMEVNVFEEYEVPKKYFEWSSENYQDDKTSVLRRIAHRLIPTRENVADRWYRANNIGFRVVLYIK